MVSTALSLKVDLPALWSSSPAHGSAEYDQWRNEIAAVVPRGTLIERDLAYFDARVAEAPQDGRIWLLALPPEGRQLRVLAIGWLRQLHDPGIELAALAEQMRSTETADEVDVIQQSVDTLDVGERPTLLLHQLLSAPDASGVRALMERFVGLSLVREHGVLVQLDVSTFDMAAFEDLRSLGADILASMVVRSAADR